MSKSVDETACCYDPWWAPTFWFFWNLEKGPGPFGFLFCFGGVPWWCERTRNDACNVSELIPACLKAPFFFLGAASWKCCGSASRSPDHESLLGIFIIRTLFVCGCLVVNHGQNSASSFYILCELFRSMIHICFRGKPKPQILTNFSLKIQALNCAKFQS